MPKENRVIIHNIYVGDQIVTRSRKCLLLDKKVKPCYVKLDVNFQLECQQYLHIREIQKEQKLAGQIALRRNTVAGSLLFDCDAKIEELGHDHVPVFLENISADPPIPTFSAMPMRNKNISAFLRRNTNIPFAVRAGRHRSVDSRLGLATIKEDESPAKKDESMQLHYCDTSKKINTAIESKPINVCQSYVVSHQMEPSCSNSLIVPTQRSEAAHALIPINEKERFDLPNVKGKQNPEMKVKNVRPCYNRASEAIDTATKNEPINLIHSSAESDQMQILGSDSLLEPTHSSEAAGHALIPIIVNKRSDLANIQKQQVPAMEVENMQLHYSGTSEEGDGENESESTNDPHHYSVSDQMQLSGFNNLVQATQRSKTAHHALIPMIGDASKRPSVSKWIPLSSGNRSFNKIVFSSNHHAEESKLICVGKENRLNTPEERNKYLSLQDIVDRAKKTFKDITGDDI